MTDSVPSNELAAKLSRLRKQLEDAKKEWEPTELALAETRVREKLMRTQLHEVETKRIRLSNELDDMKYSMSDLPNQIKKAELELQRKLQEETLRAKIQQNIDTFKARCLDSTWRKENRADGRGALEHQIDGAISLAVAKQGYLFDKRGLGKTLTSLIWADMLDVSKLIIVVPNDVAGQYVGEIKNWTPHRTVIPFYQLNEAAREVWFNVLNGMKEWTIVINYEAWRRDWSILEKLSGLQPQALVCDEAHLINKTSLKQWQGVWFIRANPNQCPTCSSNDLLYDKKIHRILCKLCGENDYYNFDGQFKDNQFNWCSVKYVLPMTGTPILNRPQEFYPLARLVEPQNFFNEEDFLREYCAHISGSRWRFRYGGHEALVKRIGSRVVMRDRKTAGVIIPPQTVQIHEIELDPIKYPKQARALSQIKTYAQLVMDEAGESVMNMTIFLTLLLRLRQGITWPAGIKLTRKDNEGKVISEQYLDVYESVKIDWTVDMIKELVEEGERVLVFSHFVEPLNELSRRLSGLGITNALYYGDTPSWKRDEIRRDFDPNLCGPYPLYQVLLGHYKAAGTGLNLHAATQTIILDLEWNPGKLDQAMGRTDRIGTTHETTVHIPKVINSVADNFMHQLINEKANTIGEFDDAAGRMMKTLRDSLGRKDSW